MNDCLYEYGVFWGEVINILDLNSGDNSITINVVKAIKSYALKWYILCSVHFTAFKK